MTRQVVRAAAIQEKLDVTAIVLGAPLWPKRTDLTQFALYDLLSAPDGRGSVLKAYALHLVRCEYGAAFAMLASWTPLLNEFLDDQSMIGSPARALMVGVYRYYADATRIAWPKAYELPRATIGL